MYDFGDGDFVNVGVGEIAFQDSAFTVGKDVGSHNFSNACAVEKLGARQSSEVQLWKMKFHNKYLQPVVSVG